METDEYREGFRGEEVYIYPPDTFLKPVLILSRTRTEFAICFANALNHFEIMRKGLERCSSSDWIKIDNYSLFEEWKKLLQDEDSFDFYIKIYEKYCPEWFKEFKRD